MNKLIITAFIVILAIAGFLLYQSGDEAAPPATAELELPVPAETPQAEAPPPVQFPVPETPVQAEAPPPEPLPPLDESDPVVVEEFNELVDEDQFGKLFMFRTFVRNFTVIIDNMTLEKLPQKFLFFRPPPSGFMVQEPETEGGPILLDPRNYARYQPYMRLVEAVDMNRLVEVYVFLYPLFQQAYIEQGYPDRYFNDRLIEVITHLLDTPDVEGPVELVQPKVYYQFADPKLEALSAGQKILLRIGPDNAKTVKAKLQELQAKLRTLNQQFE
jgi:hypothetical protein